MYQAMGIRLGVINAAGRRKIGRIRSANGHDLRDLKMLLEQTDDV